MRPTPDPTPVPGGSATDAPPRPPERAFARRIECDGGGYSADPRGPSRGGGMREPGSWRAGRGDLHG
jgi:hypothetical protein